MRPFRRYRLPLPRHFGQLGLRLVLVDFRRRFRYTVPSRRRRFYVSANPKELLNRFVVYRPDVTVVV